MPNSPLRLKDIATVIRSKNAGPFQITFDVFFKDAATLRKVRDGGFITTARIASLYGIKEEDVMEVTFFEPASALKITVKRWKSSASPGDTDVLGAQQHVPLMLLELDSTDFFI
jgi:hypothetical protein